MLFKNDGWCPVCGKETEFRAYGEDLRSTYICRNCHSRPRHRALMHVIDLLFPTWRQLSIHESSPSEKTASDRLRTQCPRYAATQFDPRRPLGAMAPGGAWQNENLERQTFPDAGFDLVVTQDVFEHIFRPDLAIREIARTLRPGGAHICTVPLTRRAAASRRRARLRDDGSVEHLLPASYHQNPIDPEGSLVTVDWGFDVASYFDAHAGLNTTIFSIENRDRGILGNLLEVLVSVKAPPPAI
jgi:SAM-dependent methyltransferase